MLRVKKIDAIIPGQAPDTRRFSHFNSTRPSPAPTWLITSAKLANINLKSKQNSQSMQPVIGRFTCF